MLAPHATTESQLRDWRLQQTIAERLCADVLVLEGFSGIDPQSPFGGPDGGKDLLCEKGGSSFVAAVYFPHSEVPFTKVQNKFEGDLAKSLQYKTDGFIFFTNQQLTPTQRRTLEEISSEKRRVCLIYHRERIRISLDSPHGYGLRLRHLGIPLSSEEQFAYFASAKDDVAIALTANAEAIKQLSRKVERLGSLQTHLAIETVAAVTTVVTGGSYDEEELAQEAERLLAEPANGHLSSAISSPLIRLIHRLVMPSGQISGRFRTTQVWLHDPTGEVAAPYEPPSWDQIANLVEKLTSSWNASYSEIITQSPEEKRLAIAKFFRELIFIHPFHDGNGRVARQIMSLQCRDLFGIEEDVILEKGVPYYRALRAADDGDYYELADLIEAAILLS